MTRNIVLIVLDCVRKDYFDEFAPRLQELVDLSFEQCRAASAWSVPSHASMFTGELPHQHGVHTHNRDYSQLEVTDTFLSELDEYRTLGTSANVYAGSSFGFDSLFDEFSDVAPTHRFPEGLDVRAFGFESEAEGAALYAKFLRAAIRHDHPVKSLGNGVLTKLYHLSRESPLPALLDDGASVVAKTARKQVKQSQEPFFQFINFMDAHGPLQHVMGYDRDLHSASNNWSSSDYDKWEVVANIEDHDEYLERYRGLYGASIEYLDRKVSAFIETVQAATEKETTFVVTADHGENLGFPKDDYLLDHTSSLTEALLHVPLAVVNPPNDYPPFEFQYVSQLKLETLVTGLARSNMPDVSSDQVPAEVIGKTAGVEPKDKRGDEWWNRMVRCVYDEEQKFEWDSLKNKYLYGLDSDYSFTNKKINMDDKEIESGWFDEEIVDYKNRAVNNNRKRSVGESTKGRLDSLGYL